MSRESGGTILWMRLLGLILLVVGIDHFAAFLPAMALTTNYIAVGAIIMGVWGLTGQLPDKFVFVSRVALGAIFIYAAIDKIVHPDEFAKIIYYYKVMPGDLINVFALILPWVELIAGIFLIVGFWEDSAAVLIGAMLAVFLVALGSAFVRGIDVSCGCFSTTSRVKGEVLGYIFRDIVMLGIVVMILVTRSKFLAIDRERRPA